MRFPKVMLLATALALPIALQAAGPALAQQRPAITVTGEGRVDAAPDVATISLGVTTEGATATQAMAANSAELARVLANLRAAGIAERDLQTSGLSLNPNWNSSAPGMSPVIAGYVASNMLSVRVRALDTLGAVLDAAVKDGANALNGVSFGLADPAPALDEARRRAVADARARAVLLTGAAGVNLGAVMSITEGGGYAAPQPMFRLERSMAADAVPVAAGEVSISAQVTIVWEIGS
ncbi:MAG: SIMPL domain-containing protein [Paracoccaceae bacterium]|nr:SIMPL domain-containing protein [Paracoccaceae bacterium]